MEALLQASKFGDLVENTLVKGRITEIRQNEVIVDIGGKSEGSINIAEFLAPEDLQINQEIDVYLEKLEDKSGSPVLSFDKAEQKKNWDTILAKCQEGTVVSGRIRSKVKGGLIVSIGVDAFLPASQLDVQPPKNLDQYLGQTHDFKVLKINQDRKNIIISRRELIEEQRQDRRRKLLSKIKVEDTYKGVVKNIVDYGVFIDIDGLDGLLHITDMSWGRIAHPSEILKVGEEVNVVILEIDAERERVSLGLKQLSANPWDNIELKYPVGVRIKGKVVSLVPYGAFIELEQGVEGLVHTSEMSWTKRITKPNELLKVGQEVEAVVLNIDKATQKVSLGIRQLEQNPWEMAVRNYPVGARVRGKIRNIVTYGAFVALEEGIDGMVHVSDISWTRKINHPSEVLKKDDEIDAIVLDVDPSQQRIALGIKQLYENPWLKINDYFKIGDIVTGKVTKITSYGAFIQLQHDIDGLVHISQISEEHVNKIKDVLSVGQEVTARVIKIDKDEHRIGLSIKAAHYDADRLAQEIAAYDRIKADEQLTSLGDILDEAAKEKERKK